MINAINAMIHKYVKIFPIDAFLTCFIVSFFIVSFTFIKSFDQKFDGTTFVVIL
jgi:hypothetical protein